MPFRLIHVNKTVWSSGLTCPPPSVQPPPNTLFKSEPLCHESSYITENLAHQMSSVSSRENIRRGGAQRGARGREETKAAGGKAHAASNRNTSHVDFCASCYSSHYQRLRKDGRHRALSEEPIDPEMVFKKGRRHDARQHSR